MRPYYSRTVKAFSLIELAISILILGLLTAGIVGGMHFIKNAEVKASISEKIYYETAIRQFEVQYGALPGDLNNAESFWVASNGDGNNNGKIDTAELFITWQHLSLARFIDTSLSGAGTDALIGVNVPTSKHLTGSGYSFKWLSTPGSWQDGQGQAFAGNYLVLANQTSGSSELTSAALMVEQAYAIDLKLDDGQPDFGEVLAQNGQSVTGCTTAVGPTNASYNFATATKVCRLYFIVR